MTSLEPLAFYPLTPELWSDFEQLFGAHGAYGGCWCMWWRITRREFEANGNEGNREAMRTLVEAGNIPGILAFYEDQPIGWCSIAPRTTYGAAERSHVLKRIDDEPVWSIVCFFVHRTYRRQGLARALINAAVKYAGSQGAHIIEAYPTSARGRDLPPVSSFMGVPELFAKNGFSVVADPSENRQVMRRSLDA